MFIPDEVLIPTPRAEINPTSWPPLENASKFGKSKITNR
jgi:hypothetical protein